MAFQNLIDENCANANPLLSFSSHYMRDHGRTEEGIGRSFGPTEVFQEQDANQLTEDFLLESATQQSFRMSDIIRQMNEISDSINPPVAPPQVSKVIVPATNRPHEYVEVREHVQGHGMDNIENGSVRQIFDQRPVPFVPLSLTNVRILHDYHNTMRELHNKRAQMERFQPVEITELEQDSTWTEGFTEQSIDFVKDNVDEKIDPKFVRFQEQLDNMIEEKVNPIFNLEDTREELFKDHNLNYHDTSCDPLHHVRQVPGSEEFLNQVEEELEAAGTGFQDEFEKDIFRIGDEETDPKILRELVEPWEKAYSENETMKLQHDISEEYEKYYDPYKTYEFQETNPMKDVLDALMQGKKLLAEGNLPGAILCFEAATQQDKNSVEAWLLLGKTQAENEQDFLAIPALRECLKLDPSNSIALMALAVSYTNESYQKQACLTLKEWILKNERYKHLVPKSDLDLRPQFNMTSYLYKDMFKGIKDLFIQAARMCPEGEIDPDVQCGLGVLFSLSNDYEKAADCFKAALQIRPNDSRLWNKWGATLANGHRSEEAVAAYHHALELSPGFIRARYNLGISCINLGAYQQAAEHFLTALNQQAAGSKYSDADTSKTMSASIWSILKLVISLLNKFHLFKAVQNRDLSELNKEFDLT